MVYLKAILATDFSKGHQKLTEAPRTLFFLKNYPDRHTIKSNSLGTCFRVWHYVIIFREVLLIFKKNVKKNQIWKICQKLFAEQLCTSCKIVNTFIILTNMSSMYTLSNISSLSTLTKKSNKKLGGISCVGGRCFENVLQIKTVPWENLYSGEKESLSGTHIAVCLFVYVRMFGKCL